MNSLRLALAGALFGLLITGIVHAAQDAGDDPIVIVLSWDGMRHDFPDRGELPALDRVAREGVRVRILGTREGLPDDIHELVDRAFLVVQEAQEPDTSRTLPGTGRCHLLLEAGVAMFWPARLSSRPLHSFGRHRPRPAHGPESPRSLP